MKPLLTKMQEEFMALMDRKEASEKLATQVVNRLEEAIKVALVKEFGPDVSLIEAMDQCKRFIHAKRKPILNQILRVKGVDEPKVLFEWNDPVTEYSYDPATNTTVATSTIHFA